MMHQQQQEQPTTMMHQQQQQQPMSATGTTQGMQGMQGQQQPNSGGSLPSVMQGHVFERLQRFHALPAELQHDTTQFEAFVEQNKQVLFKSNSHALIKSVYGVKGKKLIKTITKWLADPSAHGHSAQGTQGSTHVKSELLIRAKQIAEALVLAGFITPYNESITDLKNLDPTAPAHYVHDHELLIPVGKNVAQLNTTSVWSVTEGATYARFLKRKAGLMGQITDGKDVYLVMNQRNNVAYLFESDVAREPITEIRGESANVQCDNEHFDFGVRVALNSGYGNDKPELFNTGSKHVQEELVNAWLSIGAQLRGDHMKQMLGADARGGPHEVRDADVAAAGNAGGAGMHHQSHARGPDTGGAGTQNYQGQQQFGGHEGQSHQTPYGGTDPSQRQDQFVGQQQGSSLNGPYGGTAMQSERHQDQFHHPLEAHGDRSNQASYGDAGQAQRQDQFEGHQQDLSREIPYGGGAGSTQRQDQNFGGQEGPSLAAPYGGTGADTQQSKHQQDQQFGGGQDPAREHQIAAADAAAAQVAGIEPTKSQHSASNTQGSAPPSKYQEYTTGERDTPVQP